MSNIVAEILIRLLKPLISLVMAAMLYAVATGPLGEPGSAVLALVCWLSAAAFLLLVQESPI